MAGFLVARTTTYRDMRWGYLIDFLTPENERGVLSSLIDAALDEFRRSGVAAIGCYATDPAVRAALFRAGLFPAPRRNPIRFVKRMQGTRKDLAKFTALKSWYLTAGDGDLELTPDHSAAYDRKESLDDPPDVWQIVCPRGGLMVFVTSTPANSRLAAK